MGWKPDRLLRLILALTMFTMLTFWLPTVRGLLDGDTYGWGWTLWGMHFGGRGLRGDYWVLPLVAAFGVALLYTGWRGARPPFHWMLLLWNVPAAVEATYNAVRFPEEYRFRGDTMGIDVSLAWVGPLVFGAIALASLVWVARDLRRRERREAPPWTGRNTALLIATVSLLPLQLFLLRSGEPHGTTDKIGVVLTMLQWLLLNLSFVPWRPRGGAAQRAGAATSVKETKGGAAHHDNKLSAAARA